MHLYKSLLTYLRLIMTASSQGAAETSGRIEMSLGAGSRREQVSERVRWLRGAVAVLGALLGLAPALSPQAAGAAPGDVVELPASFQVTNSNPSQDPCLSDGRRYTIRGHITAPASAFHQSPAPPITMYLYGYEGGEWNWDLKKVPG